MDLTFGLGGLIGTGINYFSQKDTNEAQKRMSDQNIAMQRETNQQNIAMQRETNAMQVDLANTAYQRKAADLKAAGINPLMAAGGTGAGTPALNAPSGTAPRGQAPTQAPQVDTNAMKIDGAAILPLLTMANQIAISNSETARADAQARLEKTHAEVADKTALRTAETNILSTETGIAQSRQSTELAAVETNLKKQLTAPIVRSAIADATSAEAAAKYADTTRHAESIIKGSAARYSDAAAMADAGMKDQEWRLMKQMINEGVGPVQQEWAKLSTAQQNIAINSIIAQLRQTQAGQAAIDLLRSKATLGADVAAPYVDLLNKGKLWTR